LSNLPLPCPDYKLFKNNLTVAIPFCIYTRHMLGVCVSKYNVYNNQKDISYMRPIADSKPVNIILPVAMIAALDDVAMALSQPRTEVMRRAIVNHLQLGARHEIAHAQMSAAEVKNQWRKVIGVAV
jgi:predicted transcriptional regulator